MFSKYKRFLRITLKKIIKKREISSHSIALGFAIGVLNAILPFIGLQLVLTLVLCVFLKANKLIGSIAVFVTNPFTYIPIYLFTYYIGDLFFGRYFTKQLSFVEIENLLRNFNLQDFLNVGVSAYLVFFLGCLVTGLIAAIISYFTVKFLVDYYRKKRKA